jgi:ribonuclease HI
MEKILIYTDGAISGIREENAVGGIGVVIAYDGDEVIAEYSKAFFGPTRKECPEQVTNNRMELLAVIHGIINASGYEDCREFDITILSDSAYVVNGINEHSLKWLKNNFIAYDGKPIKNKDLWVRLIKLKEKKLFKSLTFKHIRGHMGICLNERADRLAVKAVKSS